MRTRIIALLLVLSLATLAQAQFALAPLPDSYREKADLYPNFHQRSTQLSEDGQNYCGPTAAANVMAWVARHGCDDLVPAWSADYSDTDLIATLAVYMKLNPRTGVSPIDLMTGFDRYCTARGYQAQIQWQGYRQGGRYAVATQPDLRWICEGVLGESNVLINIGYYSYRPETDTYTRVRGHWVTLVGYQDLNTGALRLLIHNPNDSRGTRELQPVALTHGTFAAFRDYPPGPAQGWYVLQGANVPKGAFVGVLDGAARIRVTRASE